MDKLVTFFTPTYNRAHVLHRCYESLCRQSSFDFKWLIVDDGSTDGTGELVRQWASRESRFEIRYLFWQSFCVGLKKHRRVFAMAVVLVVALFCVSRIRCTLAVSMNGSLIGGVYPENVKTCLYRDHRQIAPGDKQYVFRTSALKKVFPMPSFPGEKYFDPKYRFFALDAFGPLAVTNESFDLVDYQPEGLTNTMMRQYYNSPNSFAEYRKLYMQLPDRSFAYRLKQNIHYVSSCCLAGKLKKAIPESPRKGYTVLAFLPGILLAGIIRYVNRNA